MLRVTERRTLREWSTPFWEQCLHELGDTVDHKHALFTRANALTIVKSLITRGQFEATRNGIRDSDSCSLNVTFSISAKSDILPEINDQLVFILDCVMQIDFDTEDMRLAKKVKKQEQEIARMAHIIATYGDLARTSRINELIMRATSRHGPIGAGYYELALRVFAAEVDGSPIVFRTLGCDHPIWLRSVIRFVNAHNLSLPHGECRGNHMTKHETNLIEWCEREGMDCRADMLIVMPLRDGGYNDERTCGCVNGRMQSVSGKCKSETIIFGNAFYDPAVGEYVDEQLEDVSKHLGSWFGLCRKMFARLGWQSAQATSVYPGMVPIHELNADIAREYNKALPATSIAEVYPYNRPLSYPTIVRVRLSDASRRQC
jgi:hypothetical protein